MDLIARFAAYAAAFEETYLDDEWGRLEPYFSEDAVYLIDAEEPFGGRWEGRDAIFASLRVSLAGMDRRFEGRALELRGAPRSVGNSVEIDWKATYSKTGAPNLVVLGSERATFAGDRILLLEDDFESGAGPRVSAHIAKYVG